MPTAYEKVSLQSGVPKSRVTHVRKVVKDKRAMILHFLPDGQFKGLHLSWSSGSSQDTMYLWSSASLAPSCVLVELPLSPFSASWSATEWIHCLGVEVGDSSSGNGSVSLEDSIWSSTGSSGKQLRFYSQGGHLCVPTLSCRLILCASAGSKTNLGQERRLCLVSPLQAWSSWLAFVSPSGCIHEYGQPKRGRDEFMGGPNNHPSIGVTAQI